MLVRRDGTNCAPYVHPFDYPSHARGALIAASEVTQREMPNGVNLLHLPSYGCAATDGRYDITCASAVCKYIHDDMSVGLC